MGSHNTEPAQATRLAAARVPANAVLDVHGASGDWTHAWPRSIAHETTVGWARTQLPVARRPSSRLRLQALPRCVKPCSSAQAAPSAPAVKYVAKQIPGDIGEAINAVRFLSIDGVNAANSGHPGLPMGCAPMATVLFSESMKLNPEDPKWADRDRFVLSAGHGSMLQYSLLHLLGYPEMTVSFDLLFFCCWWWWWWRRRRRRKKVLDAPLIGDSGGVLQRAHLPPICFILCIDGKNLSTSRRECKNCGGKSANTSPHLC